MKPVLIVLVLASGAFAQTTANTECVTYWNLTTCNSTINTPPVFVLPNFTPVAPQIDWAPYYLAMMARAQTPHYKAPKVKWTKAQKEYQKCSDRARTTDERLKCQAPQ